MADAHVQWTAFREQAFARSRLDRIAPEGSPSRLGYLALGLCGEAGEAVDAAIHANTRESALSELGDVAWYLAMIEADSGVHLAAQWFELSNLQERASVSGVISRLMLSVCAVAEALKRPMQQRELRRDKLELAMCGVASELVSLAHKIGATLPEVLTANVAKNHARFGADAKGWSVERQRELDAAHKGGDRG